MRAETKRAARVAADRMARAGLVEKCQKLQDDHTKKSIRVFGDVTKRSGSILDIYEQQEDNEEPDTGYDSEDIL